MTGRGLTFGLGATAAIVVGVGASAPASAQQGRLAVDVSLSGGVATNPFLQSGDTPASASVSAQISPSYLIDTGLTQFEFRGNATITEYLKRYRNSDSFSVSAAGTHRISERGSLSARLGYINSVVGAFNDTGVLGTGVIIPGVTTVLPAPTTGQSTAILPAIDPPALGIGSNLLTDPSLGGIGSRRQSYTGGVGYSTGLGPRDRLDLDLSVVANRTKGGQLDDFNYVTQRVGYRRAIDAGFDITADLAVGHVDYLRQRVNDATTISPQVGTTYRIAQGTSLSLSVGVSIVRSELAAVGATRTNTSLSAQGSFCKSDTRWNACFSLSRSAVPSSADGVRVQTAGSVSLGMRVSERGSLSLSSSYSRSGAPLGDAVTTTPRLFAARTEYVAVRGNYDYRISPRLGAFVEGGGARAFGDPRLTRDPNYEARVGVRVRFGGGR